MIYRLFHTDGSLILSKLVWGTTFENLNLSIKQSEAINKRIRFDDILPQLGFCTLLQYPLQALYFPGWQGKSTFIWHKVDNLVPLTSDNGRPKVTSSLVKLQALAKYLDDQRDFTFLFPSSILENQVIFLHKGEQALIQFQHGF